MNAQMVEVHGTSVSRESSIITARWIILFASYAA